MRQIVWYLIAAIICVLSASAGNVSGTVDHTELLKLISQNEDPLMTSNDLAFFLASHDFDATPKDGYVEVKLDGLVFKAVPNGNEPGLADLTIIK
ncbi:MAG: hypothetical protein ABR985_00005 [Methanotrichaceae archaeon]